MYEQTASRNPLVRSLWRAWGDSDGEFYDAANECWGIAFTRHVDGAVSGELLGPVAAARRLRWHAGESYWGAELESHVFWRGLDKPTLIGALAPLRVEGRFVELGGVRFPVPGPDGLETLVESMRAHGVLIADPLVAEALGGGTPALSKRALQRRFKSAAGLGQKRIDQVRRARRAYALLQAGASPADVAFEVGYSDQAHLTRSLRVFAGQTPRQILLGAEDS